MLQRLLTCAAMTVCALPAHAGYVTGGFFLGGDLSYINSPWDTWALVFTEKLGGQLTYMPTMNYGFGLTVNTKGPRSYDTAPFLQIFDTTSESLQYMSVAVSPHAYVRLGGRPGLTQHGMRFALGVTWSRWSEVDTNTPFCLTGDIFDQRRAAASCSQTTVTTHPTRDFIGFVARAQQLSLYALSCSVALGGGPYVEVEGPRALVSLGLVAELMFNSEPGKCAFPKERDHVR